MPGEVGNALRIDDGPLLRIESELETMNAAMPRLANFILAGGTRAAALAHVARTVVRRAERRVVALAPVRLPVRPRPPAQRNGAGDDLWAPRGIR